MVTNASYQGAYGNLIKVDHGNGIETWYAHTSKMYVKVGEKVTAGQIIGAVGSTGNSTGAHLHFEIRKNGTRVNAMNYYTELAGTARYLYHNSWMAFPFGNMAKYQI